MRLKTLCDDAKKEGKEEEVVSLAKRKKLTIADAADEIGVSEEEMKKMISEF